MSCKHPPIQSPDDLHKLCKAQVALDNAQFRINSIYLPNPVFTQNPNYCLIAMEPSLGGTTPERFQSLVNQGFRNFLYSEEDFILHYCADDFLSHNYHVTDISKGAMNTAIANLRRNERYANWLCILKQELEFFSNPTLIAIGLRARAFLLSNGFPVQLFLMHYSRNNSARFRNYYLHHPQQSLTNGIHLKLKEFASKILEGQIHNIELRDSILQRRFNNELSIWRQGLFLNYMDQFSATAASNNSFNPTPR